MIENNEISPKRKNYRDQQLSAYLNSAKEKLPQKAYDALVEIAHLSKDNLQLSIACLLTLVEEGYQGQELFEQLERMKTGTGIELVPIHIKKEKVFVLMELRPPDDPFFPNQWHVPGTKWLGNEEKSDLLSRLFSKDLSFIGASEPVKAGTNKSTTVRGDENMEVWFTEIDDFERLPNGWGLFPYESLPTNTVEHHKNIIDLAVDHFVELKFEGKL